MLLRADSTPYYLENPSAPQTPLPVDCSIPDRRRRRGEPHARPDVDLLTALPIGLTLVGDAWGADASVGASPPRVVLGEIGFARNPRDAFASPFWR